MTYSLPLSERTVTNLVRSAAERFGDRPFLHFKGEVWSFNDLDRKANQFAALLAHLGVAAGSKVAIFLRNSPEWVFAWLGCAKANVAYVPINTDYAGDILAHQLGRADVSAVVIGDEFLGRVQHVKDRLPGLEILIRVGEKSEEEIDGFRCVDFDLFDQFPDADPDIAVLNHDPHAIAFTSGTTGLSKGAVAPNGHAVTFALDTSRAMSLKEGEKIYNSGMPLFHSLATWMGILPALITGSEYMLVEKFSASQFWPDIHAFGATVALGVFTLPPILLKQQPREDDCRSPLKRFIVTQQNDEFEKRFNGCQLLNAYGQTETGCVTLTPFDEEPRRGSCGRVNNETFEVRIVDEFDHECAPGVAGEITVRPKHPFVMMTEYYNMPAETVEAFRNLWFHTGDRGKLDEDGYMYFVDRKKDAMRRRGENISSYEVESVINRHPKVLESAVVAVPSPFGEDDLKAVIVPQPDEKPTHDELWDFFDENMPRFWVPRYIEFRDELPKTPNQKIRKVDIREQGVIGDCKDRESRSVMKAAN
ncbi:AMP-binding protein [Tsuneonella sp. CC-YZS046]|uniref:AMP-binding protein n=1 Tax=Tsuneonella sp. CC-YZS046 TaxID=3042152 RepID=UPI002D766CC4|nr:AMP-binding protein [Tsuneonella sp. CC-YZS046]WRO67195.1 AMP-binding protein [Tsuneonella sp. CC-YZS046]